jgi:transcriptional regulator with XRE-family HTH domain
VQNAPVAQKRSPAKYATSQRLQRAFGKKLQEARERTGTLQKVLAAELGLSRTSISNIERGTHRIFLDQVYAAAYALGVEPVALLPSIADIYDDMPIHTPADDPLSHAAAVQARDIARTVQMGLSTENRARRPRYASSRHR